MAHYLDLDLEAVTRKLEASVYWSKSTGGDDTNAAKYGWMGNPLGENVRTDGLDTYHGDFKRGISDDNDEQVMHKYECGCGFH